MKKAALIGIAMLSFSRASAQNTELNLIISSGLFSFHGDATTATTGINADLFTHSGYTNNPFGSKGGLCSGVAFGFKRISKAGILFGLEMSMESLRSKAIIDRIYAYDDSNSYTLPASGRTLLICSFLNLEPHVGCRHPLGQVSLETSVGIDIGYNFSIREDGKATTDDGVRYTTSRERSAITGDIRTRFQVGAQWRRFGAYTAYCIGLSSYLPHYSGSSTDCYSRLIRFGLSYRLNS